MGSINWVTAPKQFKTFKFNFHHLAVNPKMASPVVLQVANLESESHFTVYTLHKQPHTWIRWWIGGWIFQMDIIPRKPIPLALNRAQKRKKHKTVDVRLHGSDWTPRPVWDQFALFLICNQNEYIIPQRFLPNDDYTPYNTLLLIIIRPLCIYTFVWFSKCTILFKLKMV